MISQHWVLERPGWVLCPVLGVTKKHSSILKRIQERMGIRGRGSDTKTLEERVEEPGLHSLEEGPKGKPPNMEAGMQTSTPTAGWTRPMF